MNPWLSRLFWWTKPKPVEPVKDKTMPEIKKLPLADNQYYKQVFPKKYIFAHHTAGGSAASSVAHWASNPDHIATAFIIDRDGTIYETFDPKYWSYHLGVKGNSAIEKASIGIELCSYGALEERAGKFYTYTNKEISPEKVVKLTAPFRPGPKYKGLYWESYTPEQIAALRDLLPHLLEKFKIKMQPDRNEFWEFRNPANLLPGVWSHSTVRQDKIDIFPQREIVELVNQL